MVKGITVLDGGGWLVNGFMGSRDGSGLAGWKEFSAVFPQGL